MRKIVNYIQKTYSPKYIVVTENGVDVPDESSLPIIQAINDTFRVDYYSDYLENLLAAIQEDKVDVRGYFAWSLLDNFEWGDGYAKRFGIHYVDYTQPSLPRTPKKSVSFLTNYIRAQSMTKH